MGVAVILQTHMKPGDLIRSKYSIFIYVDRVCVDTHRRAASWKLEENDLVLIIAQFGDIGEELLVMTDDGKLGWTWVGFFEAT